MKPETLEGLLAYRDDRQPPGDFLKAVLVNNLLESFRLADQQNELDLKEIVDWCCWHLPKVSWGSREKFADWIEKVDSGPRSFTKFPV